jgi:hypothetical protein
MKAAVVHAFDQPLRIEEVLACPLEVVRRL